MNLSMSYAILSSGANSSAEPEIAVIEEQTNNTLSGENDQPTPNKPLLRFQQYISVEPWR